MTKNAFTKALSRGMLLAILSGFGLAVTPATAGASFITFVVVEGGVPGTPANTFIADLLNGGYVANLTLNGDADPTDGSGTGTWSETAVAAFSQYYLSPAAVTDSFIGDTEPLGYIILGELTSSGLYTEASSCSGSPFNCLGFTFLSQAWTLGIDTDQDGVADIPLLTASGVGTGTFGSLTFFGGPTGGAGSFNSNFLNNTLATGIAQTYWPTLANLTFVTTINGDLNNMTLPTGVMVQFTEQQTVPEPATLSLLGLGLVGVTITAARRRRGSPRPDTKAEARREPKAL